MKKLTVMSAFFLAAFAGAASAQSYQRTETAQGTGTLLGTNIIASSGVRIDRSVLTPRSGTGQLTAQGTGTPTGTHATTPAATKRRIVPRSATGRETAFGTGTPLGTNYITSGREVAPRDIPPRAGTGTSLFRAK